MTDPSGELCPGRPVAMSVSRAPVSPRHTPLVWAESAARKAMEHGLKKVDVFVKGPGSVVKPLSVLAVRRTRSRFHHRRHPQAHNGVRPPKRRRVEH
ncbi:MAG: 30S ribosomal protein S11 [Bifidobacterium pseudocatenulatum]